MRRDWLGAIFLVCCCGCAGDLRDPDRFNFLLESAGRGGQASYEDPSLPRGGARAGSAAPRGGAGGAAAVGGMSGGDDMPFACVDALFKKACISCHSGDNNPQLDLDGEGVEERLVGKPSSQSGSCGGRTLVSTDGMPSLLLQKLSAAPPCGARMPVGPMLTNAEIDCVTKWVDSVSNDGEN